MLFQNHWPAFSTRVRSFSQRRLFWLGLVLGLLVVIAVLLAYAVDEPLRRQTESRINAALKGYTVRIGRLDFHPIGFSLDLEDTVIYQDANSDPPVAQIPLLSASVEWKALLLGRVVADFAIERPVLSINLAHSRSEERDSTKLHERGWQAALQAIYPLEINEFAISNGRVTYTDRGPYRPLEIRDLDFVARNIRNIRSGANEYPSDVSLRGAVFEKGRVELRGNADFLAEPHVAFKADVDFDQIDLSYFRPLTERYRFAVRAGVVSTAGTMEYSAGKKILNVPELRIDGLVTDYLHAKSDTAPTEELSKKTDRVIQERSNDPGLELRMDRIRIVGAELGMVNKAASPEYRLYVTHTRLEIDNLSNQGKDGVATARATGLFMGSGKAQASARLRPRTKSANFDLALTIEETDMKTMNKLFLASGSFDVTAGLFSLFTEIAVRDGVVDGYVKPLFRNVDIYSRKQDRKKNIFRQMYEGILGGVSWLLENRPREEVATTTRLSGRLSTPETSAWEVALGLIQNAFFQAVVPGLERSLESGDKK